MQNSLLCTTIKFNFGNIVWALFQGHKELKIEIEIDQNAVILINWYLLKSRFFKNRELYWSNLPQNSNLGWESFVEKFGVQIPVEDGRTFCHFSFCFTCFILSIKLNIKVKLPLFYINKLHRNKIKFVHYTYFYWYLIGKRR